MDITLSSQLFGFAVSVPAGILLGAFYDVFRIWRAFFHTEKRAVFFQDLFYMATAALFTFLLALAVSCGEVRFYLLFGEVAGWFVYYFTLGQITAFIFGAVSGFLYRFLFYPLQRLYEYFFILIKKIMHCFARQLKKIGTLVKNRLKPHAVLVYNHSNRMLRSRRKKRQKGVLKHERNKKAKIKSELSP